MNAITTVFTSLFGRGVWQPYADAALVTILVTVLGTAFAYILGIPVGVFLYLTGDGGICSTGKVARITNKIVGFIVNVLRSVPFIILLVMTQPVAKFIVGKKTSLEAFIVYLVIAAAPYVARMIESSLKETNAGIIEAAQAMGSNTWQIIWKVLLPEAKPSLLVGGAIAITTILGYTPMTYLVGQGGLGAMAIQYGLYRFNETTMYISALLLVVIVQIIQEAGLRVARKTDHRVRQHPVNRRKD